MWNATNINTGTPTSAPEIAHGRLTRRFITASAGSSGAVSGEGVARPFPSQCTPPSNPEKMYIGQSIQHPTTTHANSATSAVLHPQRVQRRYASDAPSIAVVVNHSILTDCA